MRKPFGAARGRSVPPFDQKAEIMAASYLIDGKEAQGEDYARAIDALPSDDLGFVRVKIPETGTVMVSTYPGGFIVTDERLDGSSWTSPTLAKDRVKDLVASFLRGDDWREGLQWELTTLTTRDAWRRTLRIVLIGVVVIALALGLIRLFTK
jgi:hypothetical protein